MMIRPRAEKGRRYEERYMKRDKEREIRKNMKREIRNNFQLQGAYPF